MSFKVSRWVAATVVFSLLIQMQFATSGHADGRPKIAFSSTRDGNSEIYVMDSDGRNQVRLTDDPANDLDSSWSPDGDRIAFVSNRERGVEQIYVMDSDGGNAMRLTTDSTHQEPAWSPVGEKIAYVRNKGGRQIWIMDADGGNQQQLTQIGKNRQPAWSPDGARIAYVSRRHGGQGIYVMDANGSNQKRLTRGVWSHDNPSWSPDGQWIAHDFWHKGAVYQIFVVRTDGSGLSRRLTRNEPHKRFPVWSPDGGTIAYVQESPFENTTIHLMTANGEYLKQLSEEHDGSDTDPDWFDPVGWSVSPATNFVTMWGEIKKPTADRR